MTQFFHGWRRKAGCAMLVMALAFAVAWARSFHVFHEMKIRTQPTTVHFIVSSEGGITWMAARGEHDPVFWPMKSWIEFKTLFGMFPDYHYFKWNIRWHRQFCGFHFGEVEANPFIVGDLSIWTIPHWSVVMLLTLLSGYLLLSKPPKKNEAEAVKLVRADSESTSHVSAGSELPAHEIPKAETLPLTRLGWGIACAAVGMLANFGIPLLLMILGLDPHCFGSGIAAAAIMGFVGALWIASGLAGLIIGIVRPGVQSLSLTLICLVVADLCLACMVSVQVYTVSAIIKVALARSIRAKSQLVASDSTADKT